MIEYLLTVVLYALMTALNPVFIVAVFFANVAILVTIVVLLIVGFFLINLFLDFFNRVFS